jgi:16S rRNA (cytidine1402-2'-O)-methyltransferase
MSDLGKLYVIATPIGNLGDITVRAIALLKEVHLIAAEDTRQSKKLLMHYGINTSLLSLHAHNEQAQTEKILTILNSHESVAFITDAGTPLISDPGAHLVKTVRAHGYKVVPIPGPCAAITALSAAGLNEPHFYFEGFLPNKSAQRKERLLQLKNFASTLIFYEAPHRVLATLRDMADVLGNREAVIARELTKKFETIMHGSLHDLHHYLFQTPQQQRGEFVLLVFGNYQPQKIAAEKITATLKTLMKELPLKQAVSLASELLETPRNDLYTLALQIRDQL